jgi:hypothetical protein
VEQVLARGFEVLEQRPGRQVDPRRRHISQDLYLLRKK